MTSISHDTIDTSHRRGSRHTRGYEPEYETRETYIKREPRSSRDLVYRPAREDSDLSIEEVRREFPPPGAEYVRRSVVRDDAYPLRRTRSLERDRNYIAYE